MDQSEINNRLSIIKYLYMMGCETLSGGSPISKATCVLQFHDAVESFFTLVSEILGVKKTNLNFMDYFEEIRKTNGGVSNRELTHKIQMKKLNELRVNFKHMGILPNEEECNNLKTSLDDFFHENVPKFCNMDFDKISLANSIQDEEVRKLIHKAEELVKNEDYKGGLSILGRAFYMLFHKSQKKTKTAFGKSAVFLSPKVNLFHMRLPFQASHEMEKIINDFYEPLAEALNIIILGIDYKKYAKFKCLVPGFIPMANGNMIQIGAGKEFNTRFNINKTNTDFCYFFIIDSALKIERFNFGLISAWEKPDMVSAIAEDNVPIYQEKEGKFETIMLLPQKKIIKLTGGGKSSKDENNKQINYNEVIVDQITKGWVESSKIIQIDNPELQKT